MSNFQEQKPQLVDSNKFALYGPYNPEAKGRPSLKFNVFKGNPAIVVFPNDPSDTERKPIRAGMDALAWSGFISQALAIVDAENGTTYRIVNRAGAPAKKFVDSTTVIMKDESGVISIAILKDGRAKKKFKVLPGDYHGFCKGSGEEMSEAEASQIYAKGFFTVVNDVVTKLMVETFEPPQQRSGGGGNRSGGGGYNNNGGGASRSGGSGGGDDFDDDIPM